MLRCIIILFLTLGFIEADARKLWMGDIMLNDSATSVLLDGLGCKVEFEVCGTLSPCRDGEGLSPAWWGVRLIGEADTTTVSLQWGNTRYGMPDDERYMLISSGDEAVRLTSGVSLGSFENTLSLEIAQGKEMAVYVGRDLVKYAFTVPLDVTIREIELFVVKGKLDVAGMGLVESEYPHPVVDVACIEPAGESIAGVWKYIDRDSESRLARLGGKYTLNIIEEAAGDFVIVYQGGAQINPGFWKPGMVKGYLKPLPIDGAYSLRWYDSAGELLVDECSATLDGDMLTFSFPLLQSSMRFYRE